MYKIFSKVTSLYQKRNFSKTKNQKVFHQGMIMIFYSNFSNTESGRQLDFKKQGNRGDMRKIHMIWQFFQTNGPLGHFFEKKKQQKICFQIWSRGVYVLNYRSVSFFVWSGGLVQINKPTDQLKIGISSNSCSPHVDFDNINYN